VDLSLNDLDKSAAGKNTPKYLSCTRVAFLENVYFSLYVFKCGKGRETIICGVGALGLHMDLRRPVSNPMP
jgi:hypothetical protein